MFKWFGIVVGVIVIAITTLFVGARFSDGPMAMLPGGAFQSGKTLDYPANFGSSPVSLGRKSLHPGVTLLPALQNLAMKVHQGQGQNRRKHPRLNWN